MGKLAPLAAMMWVLVACGTPDDATTGDATPADIDAAGTQLDAPTASDTVLFEEPFDAGAWDGWQILGGVASATIEGSRGRLVPTVTSYSLGRMGHALPGATPDVEASFVFEMSDPTHQGVGFYVRQNGGYLTQTATHGGGYCVFVEAFRGPQIGLWRERDGTEESLVRVAVAALDASASYRVRFRVVQSGAATQLDAKLWPSLAPEPAAWTVSITDTTPALQNVAGALAVDAWNTATPGNGPTPAPVFIDAIVVSQPAPTP